VRCFAGDVAPAGDSPGVGDWACTAKTVASPIAKERVRNLLVMTARVSKPGDYSQCISSGQQISAQKTANDVTPAASDTSDLTEPKTRKFLRRVRLIPKAFAS